jgi:hypothetical protein
VRDLQELLPPPGGRESRAAALGRLGGGAEDGEERDRGRRERRVEADIWVLRVVGWYGIWNIEVD